MIEILFGSAIYAVTLVSCYDGDTCKIRYAPSAVSVSYLREQSIRFDGFDTPEINGRCAQEKRLAQQARAITTGYMRGRASLSTEGEIDRYGRLIVSAPGLKNRLITGGLAREYHGGRRDRDAWCR